MFVTGLVLAAGGSTRLGQPKQLLPYRGATLLDATLNVAREAEVDQLVVALGGSAKQLRAQVDLSGFVVVDNPEFGTGCSSSIGRSMSAVDARADGLLLMLGDQPEINAEVIQRLVACSQPEDLGVCRYANGRGHPLWLGRAAFGDLMDMHGDKAVWKLLGSQKYPVSELAVDDAIPADINTWDDYEALLGRDLTGRAT